VHLSLYRGREGALEMLLERPRFVSSFVIQIIHVIHSVGCLLTKIHCPITINADIVNTSLEKHKKSHMYKYTVEREQTS
jgi:hypothetical protein